MAGLLWYRSYMDSLANTSGYYPDIHAGHADRVTELTLDTPYLVRETPAGYNQLELMELVGGSVAWNQLCNSSSVTGTSGHKFYLKKSGAESITNTNTFTGLASGTDMVTDLTLMLGSAIADYVYSLEQATAGSGVEWLKRYGLIDGEYHAYSAPTLEHVKTTAHINKDADDNVLGTYPFDSSLLLRGIPKLDSGALIYDGDTYDPDGTVTRKYGEVTFDGSSDEDWKASGSYAGNYYWSLSVPNGKNQSTNVINTYTPNIAANTSDLVNYNRCIYIEGGAAAKTINIKNPDIASVADFKTWIASNPITVVYELATQTTESADPYTAVQDIEEGGTEEFVTSNNAPVGNVSVYRRA